jgi:hypothetical protein
MGRGVGAGRTFTSGGVTAARSVVDGAGVEAVAGNPPGDVLTFPGALLLVAAEVGGFAGETFGLAAATVPVDGAVPVAGVALVAGAVLVAGAALVAGAVLVAGAALVAGAVLVAGAALVNGAALVAGGAPEGGAVFLGGVLVAVLMVGAGGVADAFIAGWLRRVSGTTAAARYPFQSASLPPALRYCL